MNVAFLANSFHLQKTKSTDFLIDLLREWFGEVTVIPHKEAWAKLPGTRWDLIVSFQHLWSPEEFEAFGAHRTVIVPMFDDCPKDQAFWQAYLGFRILSFSSTLGTDLARWGHDVQTVQYWPPVPLERQQLPGLRGFFWPRTTGLGWSHVRTLLGDSSWEEFHLHITNPEGAHTLPDDAERVRWKVRQTDWFEDPAEAKAAVARSSVYFAPRRAEGIGQAVLEAMALGLCVVAPDGPTMNEYLVHGKTGLLFDPEQPGPLDFSQVEELGRNARASSLAGRAAWLSSASQIRDFLIAPPRLRSRRFHPLIVAKGRVTAALRVAYRLLKRLARRA